VHRVLLAQLFLHESVTINIFVIQNGLVHAVVLLRNNSLIICNTTVAVN